MPEASTRALRKDAAVNRERLLAAARELFAQRGLNVTLNDIAHHAGVGVATAYRRFANKEEVIDALFEEGLQAMAAAAQDALADEDAWRGLVTFLERSMHMQFGDRGLNEIMNNPALGDARVSDARDRLAPLIQALVDRAKEQQAVRPDFEQSDVIFMQVALSAIIESSRAVEPELYHRYLTILLDGIRVDRAAFTPLPVAALSADRTHAAMTRRRVDGGARNSQAHTSR
jgi:AcrR family transcriptional regulator